VDRIDFSTFVGASFDMSAADNTLPTGLTINLRHTATLFGEVDPDWFLVDDLSDVADLAVGEVARDPA
jgi:hypothetical protein